MKCGVRVVKGKKLLRYLSCLYATQRGQGLILSLLFWNFHENIKIVAKHLFVAGEYMLFQHVKEDLAFNTTRSFSSLTVLIRVNLCFVLFVQFKLNVFYSSKIHQRFLGKPQNGCFLIDRYSRQRE